MGERSTGASGQDQSVAAWEAGRKVVPDSPSFDFKILCDTLDNWKLWEEVTDSPSFFIQNLTSLSVVFRNISVFATGKVLV